MTAEGMKSGRIYAPADIDDEGIYAQMMAESLLDNDGTTVVPVRKIGAPHFRRLGPSKSPKDLPRKPDTQRHNDTIKELVALLNDPARSFQIVSKVFSDDKPSVSKEQVLVCSRPSACVRWFSENQIRFDDFTRIQPDISARDISRMSPTGSSPALIIEVVDKHFPEPETFEKLMALSRSAHQIYFYILGKNPLQKAQKLNSYTTGSTITLRITFALIGGELVQNCQPQKIDDKEDTGQFEPQAGAKQAEIDALRAAQDRWLRERSKVALAKLIKRANASK